MAGISLTLVVCLGLVGLASCHSLNERREELREKFGEKMNKFMEKMEDKVENLKDRFQKRWDRWEYDGEEGTEHWAKHFHACGHHHQSPVNLPHYFQHDKYDDLGDIEVKDDIFDQDTCDVENDGRTAKLTCNAPMTLHGGGLDGEYAVAESIFHWGEDDKEGSEHRIGGRHYPMEMQVVAYNTKYPDLEDAMEHHDGLAVLGVFFKVANRSESGSSESSESASSSSSSESMSSSNSSESLSSESGSSSSSSESMSSSNSSESLSSESGSFSNSSSESSSSASSSESASSTSNSSSSGSSSVSSSPEWSGSVEEHEHEDMDNLKPLVQAVKQIRKAGMKATLNAKVLRALLPRDMRRFYRYHGSLTKPPCSRANWIIFRHPIFIGEDQLEEFRALMNFHSQPIRKNTRPVQTFDDRHIHLN